MQRVAACIGGGRETRSADEPMQQIGREINTRQVILDPAPAWLLGLLGSATMAAVAGRGARALARMLPRQARKVASNLANTAQSVMRESGAHPFALLGFDPIQLWDQVRALYQPPDGRGRVPVTRQLRRTFAPSWRAPFAIA